MRLMVCLLLVVLAACKDDELYGINSDTRTYLLANKKWQTAAIYVKNSQGIVIRDDYALLPDYKKDDFLFLRADSTFELNDNTSKDPLAVNPILASGTWMLINKEQYLKLNVQSGSIYSDSLRVTGADGNNLIVETPVIDGIQIVSYRAIQ